MTFRKAEKKVAASDALKQLNEFTQYLNGIVDGEAVTPAVMGEITKKIRAFEQEVITTLGAQYKPTSASLPKPGAPPAAASNPADPKSPPPKTAGRGLYSRPAALDEDDDD
jgi:hypothetical protein